MRTRSSTVKKQEEECKEDPGPDRTLAREIYESDMLKRYEGEYGAARIKKEIQRLLDELFRTRADAPWRRRENVPWSEFYRDFRSNIDAIADRIHLELHGEHRE